MNTSNGWIKLYRCLLDDAVCQKSTYFHLWVTLLLMAAHKEHEFIFNNEIHKVTPGQLITGRKKLSKLTGIPETTIRRILKCFENGHMIQRKITSKYTVITITKWEKYQSELFNEHPSGHQMAIKRPASGQQLTTYKNEKNVKNEKTLSGEREISLNDLNDNNDPLLQDTLRKAQEYENEQRRIREMFHQRNP